MVAAGLIGPDRRPPAASISGPRRLGICLAPAVTARKDDAAAADQAAIAKIAVSVSSARDGGLIQTISG